MTTREIAFVLIGLGTGLLLSVAVVIAFIVWFHHMFIVGVRLQPGAILLLLPVILILVGLFLLQRKAAHPQD